VATKSQEAPAPLIGELVPSSTTPPPVKPKRPRPSVKMGRPLKFKSTLDLQTQIDAYFKDRDPHIEEYTDYEYPLHETSGRPDYSQEKIPVQRIRWTDQKPYTVSSLAVFLNTSRETLMDYEGKKDFSDAIRAAKDKCAAYNEDYMYSGKNVTGAIFNAKVNFGLRDDDQKGAGPLDLPGGLHFHNHIESKKTEYGD
jgi:hypothetical protein